MFKKPEYLYLSLNAHGISRARFITGLIIGLFYAFSFYSLLYMSRESLRILSVTEQSDLWIFTNDEVNFYNLVFAFIATIFGQSVCFAFWIYRPKKVFGRNNFRKVSIINDQTGLIWYFLLWFTKLGFLYAVFFGFLGGFYVFSFYPRYNFLFVLIIIVLYLHSWNTIRLVFKNKSLKWLLISIVTVSSFSISLSRINLIDYNSINETLLYWDVYYRYKLDIAESNTYERLENLSLVRDIYVVKSKEALDNKPIIVANNREIEIKDLSVFVQDWFEGLDLVDIPRLTCQLHIHKEIKMDFIDSIKQELSLLGVTRIAYAVVPANPEYNLKYYRNHAFWQQILDLRYKSDPFLPPPQIKEHFDNVISIEPLEQMVYLVNKTTIIEEDLKEAVLQQIIKSPDYIVKIVISKNLDFATYFKVLSIVKDVINELRNEYAQELYSMKYDDLDMEQKYRVEWKFPFSVRDTIK